MPKRPSKPFLLIAILMAALGIYLFIDSSTGYKATPGEVVFRKERPAKGATLNSAISASDYSDKSSSWLGKVWDNIATWENNPWKRQPVDIGSRYWDLSQSDDPLDQKEADRLRALGKELHQRVLERYPELAVELKEVAPEDNGFLQWLELIERLKEEQENPHPKIIDLPSDLRKMVQGKEAWDPATAKAWLDQERALLDEIRAIGLLPDQSTAGIDVHRWVDTLSSSAMHAVDALLLDARLAADSGNVQHAMESVQAASGLSRHIGAIESPALLNSLINSSQQVRIQNYTFTELLPLVPPGQFDPAAWQTSVNPQTSPPSIIADMLRGEWNALTQEYLFPVLVDAQEPNYPPDPDALIDVHTSYIADLVNSYDNPDMSGWENTPADLIPDTSHLSRHSREIIEQLTIGMQGVGRNMRKGQIHSSMTQAAFAIMQGQPIPPDPIHGLPYQWDPATRQLSTPNTPFFTEMKMDPITVPQPPQP